MLMFEKMRGYHRPKQLNLPDIQEGMSSQKQDQPHLFGPEVLTEVEYFFFGVVWMTGLTDSMQAGFGYGFAFPFNHRDPKTLGLEVVGPEKNPTPKDKTSAGIWKSNVYTRWGPYLL